MDGEAPPNDKPNLQNKTPELMSTGFGIVTSIVESYGWFMLLGLGLIAFLYQKYKPTYEKWKREQDSLREDELRKKDPDRAYAVQLSMEQARLRMQEKVSADAETKRIKDQEVAERKRLEKIEEWEKHKQGKGYHSKSKVSTETDTSSSGDQLKSKKSNTFRPSYNPLSGDGGGSSGYRPSRNTGRSGGG